MFATLQEIRAEVFARVPDALRVRNRSNKRVDVHSGPRWTTAARAAPGQTGRQMQQPARARAPKS